MLRRREQRVDKSFALIGLEERCGQPRGLVGVPDRARLLEVAGPEYIVRRRALAIVGDDHAGRDLSTEGSQKCCAGSALICGADTMVKSCGEAETQSKKGRQTSRGLLLVSPWKHHRNRNDAAWPEDDLLSPMRIEKRLRVEFDVLAMRRR